MVDQRIESTEKKFNEEKDPVKLEEIKMWLGYYKAIKKSFDDFKMTLPALTITDSLTIHDTNIKALLFTKGKGHTESDLVLWLPEDRILFTGDLLFVQNLPWLGDGFLQEWISYLEYLLGLNAERIGLGHGPITNNESFDLMIQYIRTVNNIVDDALKNKTSAEELSKTQIPEAFQNWWLGRFFIPNLMNLYELKAGTTDR